MENNNNIFLGKIEKSGCYVNNGRYGYCTGWPLSNQDSAAHIWNLPPKDIVHSS